ncbi:DUF2993 domain-containing protein [Streptomyces sp. V4-01]|uniref:DUF2993 domain-containing protein n=1 Tax=Actinacidiphila polyblastidii TaxID=3110430 RepID=A0ABU7PHX4_9ACTN|nr:DUF2993 domain-containing protein [Streptomyces sp. V4-01]
MTSDPGRTRPPGGTTAAPTEAPAQAQVQHAPAQPAPADRAARPTRRRWPRRRPLLAAGAAVAALVVLAGAGNVLLARTARQHIVNAADCRLRPVGRISAHLSGSLAGLRLLTGDVGTVRIAADDVRRDGTTLSVAAELRDVTTKGHSSGGSATATIAYGQLAERLGGGVAGLRPGPDGSGGLALTGTLAGIPLPVTVHARIAAGNDRLTVTPADIVILGQDFPVARLAASGKTAPQLSTLAGRLGPRTVAVPQLPAGVRLTGATAAADGLRLTLAISPAAVSRPSKGCST